MIAFDAQPDGRRVPEPAGSREVLTLIHHHPGRLRVRALAFQDAGVGADVLAALEAVPGVGAVRHNPRTGSILVEYEPGLVHAEAVLSRIAATAGLAMPSDDLRVRGREPAVVAIGAAREVNELVHELTGYRADLRTLVPMGMAALAAYNFATTGSRMPRWDNLLYWSYNIFTQLHRREIERGSGAPADPPGHDRMP